MSSHDRLLISVIIPVYNGDQFIDRAINSALDQKEEGEVIIIDDASTDKTEKVCEEFCNRNTKVKYLKLQVNQGPAAARNIGLKHKFKVLDRYLSNTSITTHGAAVDILCMLVTRFKRNGYIPILTDWTREGEKVVLSLAVAYKRRAIPFYWDCFRYEDILKS